MEEKPCQRCGAINQLPNMVIAWNCSECGAQNSDFEKDQIHDLIRQQWEAYRWAELAKLRGDARRPYKRFGKRR